jgi:hexosaminidase
MLMMKLKIKAWSFSLLIMASGMASAQDYCPVIPAPLRVAKTNSLFVLNSNTPIVLDNAAFKPIAQYLQEELLKTQQLTLSMQPAVAGPAIRFVLSTKKKLPAGAYSLEINKDGITIAAKESAGAFYGAVSLLQVIRQSKRTKGSLSLAGWNMEDQPALGWWVFLLDESRNFFGMEK